jgi:hypothetical protein
VESRRSRSAAPPGQPTARGAIPPVLARARAAARALAEIFYGATGYEFERQAAQSRADLENLFVFLVMGDYLGVPVLPPYYALRLVPYLMETLPYWRRRVLRPRGAFEGEEFDLHGV